MKLDQIRTRLRSPKPKKPKAPRCAQCGVRKGTCKVKLGKERQKLYCQWCSTELLFILRAPK